MMTVHEVSDRTGVSIRALQYYDRIGLLRPAGLTDAGYRLYDDSCLEKLQQILLFRELEFPLKEIREIVSCPDFDRDRVLHQQLDLLMLKKEHIEGLICLARRLLEKEVTELSFDAFDKKKLEEYAAEAKASWGATPAYAEYEERSKGRSDKEERELGSQMMEIFKKFGELKTAEPSSDAARALVQELQDFITAHYYTCTREILSGLGKMYAAGGAFTDNIDAAGGHGTASFAAEAIDYFCRS